MADKMDLHNKIADEVRLQESGVTKREAKEAKEAAAAKAAPTGLDRQLSDLITERENLNTEGPEDAKVPHEDHAVLARVLDIATDPKAKQADSLNAAEWAGKNDRPDIVQAIVDKAEAKVHKEGQEVKKARALEPEPKVEEPEGGGCEDMPATRGDRVKVNERAGHRWEIKRTLCLKN